MEDAHLQDLLYTEDPPEGLWERIKRKLSKFYVYLWLRKDGTPYYVGKGTGRRAYTSAGHGVHKPNDKEHILIHFYLTEEEAFEAEKILIAFYGRQDTQTGILRNRTDGGENPPRNVRIGHVVSAETRAKLRAANLGKKQSVETRRKHSENMRGNRFRIGKKPSMSPEVRRKIGDAHRGKILSPETKEKLRIANLGKKASPETKLKMSEANKHRVYKTGWHHTPAAKQKISIASKGRIFSEETRAKLRKVKKGQKPFLGRKHTEESKQKMRRSQQCRFQKMDYALSKDSKISV